MATSTFTQLLSSEACGSSSSSSNVALRPHTVRTARDGEPKTATSTFTQLMTSLGGCVKFSVASRPHTETVRTIRDGEPRGATPILTRSRALLV